MIYDKVVYNDKLRVCFDTCHVSDAGYDIIHDFDGVMEHFDKLIGKDEMQLSFFSKQGDEKQEKLDKTIDNLKEKYGYNFITRAGKMNVEEIVKIKGKK